MRTKGKKGESGDGKEMGKTEVVWKEWKKKRTEKWKRKEEG